ncbi:MAG: OadG family protein [Syntrophales bacterium]|nr:OadG family protein [Syntrophales bacterium]HPL62220.1 OadG family protein [Syntrophales bacterium]
MDKFTFGVTMTVIGMGGTLLSIWLLSLVIDLLRRIFPFRESENKE